MTLKFIDWLCDCDKLPFKKHKEKIVEKIQSINPNSNGFDIEITSPEKVIAEVKGNIPINEGLVFGSNQNDGIKKDFSYLMKGKSKSEADIDDSYKFFILPDHENTRKAINHLLDNLKKNENYKDYKFKFPKDKTEYFDKEYIYIVFVDIDTIK